MSTSVSFALKDKSGDEGYTGFTIDKTCTLQEVTTYAQAVAALSDCELSSLSIKFGQRVVHDLANCGDNECEKRGVCVVEQDDGTTKRRYSLTIPGISQTNVEPNKIGGATVKDAARASLIAAFATLSGIQAAKLFDVSSRIYESRR